MTRLGRFCKCAYHANTNLAIQSQTNLHRNPGFLVRNSGEEDLHKCWWFRACRPDRRWPSKKAALFSWIGRGEKRIWLSSSQEKGVWLEPSSFNGLSVLITTSGRIQGAEWLSFWIAALHTDLQSSYKSNFSFFLWLHLKSIRSHQLYHQQPYLNQRITVHRIPFQIL